MNTGSSTQLARRPAPRPAPVAEGDTPLNARQVAALFLLSHRGRTQSAYETDLKQWFEWCDAFNLDGFAVRRAHVDSWVTAMEQRSRSAATIARKIAAVRGFYVYAMDEEFAEYSPVPTKNEKMHLPKVSDVSTTLGPDRQECIALLSASKRRGEREHAVISVLIHQGLRVSELCALDLSDMREERGHRVIRLRRKGGKEQDQVLSPEAGVALDAYLAVRGRGAGPLVLSNTGGRLSRFHVNWLVKAVTGVAGITRKFSPHSMRHACVTLLLDAGVPIRDVQVFAGHADPKTTQRYDLGRKVLDNSPAYALRGMFS